jgi:membrane protease YdiL (CAAX protease family)
VRSGGRNYLARVPLRSLAGCWSIAAGLLCAGALGFAMRDLEDPVLAISLGAAAVELVILGVAVGIALLLPGSARARLGWLPSRLRPAEIALLAAGTLSLSHALDAALVRSGLYWESGLSDFTEGLRGARGLPLAVAVLAVGALAPLAEELLCRGLVQRSLVPRLGRVAGVGLAALGFGLLHVEPIHAALAAVLGVYLGVAGLWAGSVIAPIACHLVNNGFALAVAVQSGASTQGSLANVVLGSSLAAASLFLVRRNSLRRLQKEAGSDDG